MTNGIVKWYNTVKGYGFIQPADGSRDVFVHVTALQQAGLRTLSEKQKIRFDAVMKNGKVSAENLEVL